MVIIRPRTSKKSRFHHVVNEIYESEYRLLTLESKQKKEAWNNQAIFRNLEVILIL